MPLTIVTRDEGGYHITISIHKSELPDGGKNMVALLSAGNDHEVLRDLADLIEKSAQEVGRAVIKRD